MKSLTRTSWRTRTATLTAAAAVGAAAVLGPGTAAAVPLFSDPWKTLGLEDIVGLLGDPTVGQYVGNTCASGADSVTVGDVTVDCSRSTGNGTAVVLPGGSIDLAANDEVKYSLTADGVPIQIGNGSGTTVDIEIENLNLIQIISGAALDPMFSLYNPVTAYEFKTYQEVVDAANLPVEMSATGQCLVLGVIYDRPCGWGDKFLGGKDIPPGDKNLAKRTRALKVAGYLNNATYDPTKPVDLTAGSAGAPAAGSARVVGDGVQLALAMTGGTARADSYLPWSIATAGAANGRNAHAQSIIGISNALNTDTLGLTWFGSPLDMTKVMPLLELAEADDLIALSETSIPAFKEVSCFGVYTRASADGLGSCTNILGTFDYYRDHATGQRQFGITDVTSLFMGGDQALVSQLSDPESEFMSGLLRNLTQADSRLKFAKDFIRFTSTPVTDPETGTTHTAYWLTSDYGLTAPIVVELAGYQLTFFPGETVNGAYRPNLIGLPQLKKLGADADSGLLPKVSLIAWANPFGLGTLSLDEPLNPIRTVTDYAKSITVVEDLGNIGTVIDLVGDGWNARTANQERNATVPEIDPGTGDDGDTIGGDTNDGDTNGGDTNGGDPADQNMNGRATKDGDLTGVTGAGTDSAPSSLTATALEVTLSED